jgi:hypothetical protein
MNESVIKVLHEKAKKEAETLRQAGHLPPLENQDEDVLAHSEGIEETFVNKFLKGAKEHGGSIHDRNPFVEVRQEIIDLWHYTAAAEERYEAMRKYYTSPEYHAAICNEYQARFITGFNWSGSEFLDIVRSFTVQPITLTTLPSPSPDPSVDSRTGEVD